MRLKRATVLDAANLWKMQKIAFEEMLARYEDYDTSPACESLERVEARLSHPHTFFYYLMVEERPVGAIRIVDKRDGSRKRISPLFIMPEYRNRGYAQQAMAEAEIIHGANNWELDTILQEEGNCHLYEKMGYRQTGKTKPINEKMTIVFYEKD